MDKSSFARSNSMSSAAAVQTKQTLSAECRRRSGLTNFSNSSVSSLGLEPMKAASLRPREPRELVGSQGWSITDVARQ